MDLQTMGDNALTSENALSHNNLRAHSPQTAGDSRPQPDTPIGLEESWRNANSCARCRSPGCAVPYEDPRPGRSAAPTAAAYTEATAGERHVSRLDGDSQPPDDPFSSLRRPLEKRLPRESGPDAPRRGARPPGTGETPSPSGSRGTRSARGGPGKRPAPRADDSTARRTRDYGRARAPP